MLMAGPDTAQGQGISRLGLFGLIGGVALVLMAPAMLFGTWHAASMIHNITWTDGIAAEMAQATLYPRWLSNGFAGLGAPSFYYYPPLPFLVTGTMKLWSGGLLSANAAIQLYALLVMAGSGLAMWFWLAPEAGERPALLASLAYMAMPYHLVDHYLRAALGEFSVYLVLPLLLAAMRRAAAGKTGGMPAVSLCYAALILTHLPSAVLASVFLVPAYALWLLGLSRVSMAGYARLALGFAAGVLLSSAYLLPALLLQQHINSRYLWLAGYRPRDWLIWNLSFVTHHIGMVVACYILMAFGMFSAWLTMRREGTASPAITAVSLWSIALLAVILGVIPGLWDIGPLAAVQFPWRLLTVVDLLWITGFALILQAAPDARPLYRMLAIMPGVMFGTVVMLAYSIEVGVDEYARGEFIATEPPEYLPSGVAQYRGSGRVPLSVVPPLAGSAAVTWDRGAAQVTVTASRPALVVLPIHFFPAWTISREGTPIAAAPSGRRRLLSFVAAPGTNQYLVTRHMLREERIGWMASLGGLLLTLGCAGWEWRRARRRA